ncbi:cytochrome P450 [Aspergillus aurantiobrunneus]
MLETVQNWLFAVACVLLILHELYYSVFQHATYSRIRRIVNDFRNRRFYRPWAARPILIPPTQKMMAELSETRVLSQRAVYADMFGFRFTINGLDHNEVNSRRSRLYSRVLLVQGPAQLPSLYMYLCRNLRAALDVELQGGVPVSPGTVSVKLAALSERVLSRLMSVWFFGENLASDMTFRDALLRHPRQIKTCMGAFQLTPSFLAPLVHAIITQRGKTMQLIQNKLIDLMTRGVENWDEPTDMKKLTLLYNLIDASEPRRSYWTPSTLSQAVLGLWLAASHQPWVNLHAILLELCARPTWQAALRKEALEHQAKLGSAPDPLPLLDSFMRETARVTSLDRGAIRRKALADYTFSSGPFVPAGSTVCVFSHDVSRNASVYPDPEQFDGSRFLNGRSKDAASKFADVSEHHLMWGYGSLACPGRHHAEFILKLVVAHILSNYDLRLADPEARRWWSWEDFTMPYQSTRVLFSKRQTEAVPS